MQKSTSQWRQAVWIQELLKEENATVNKPTSTMEKVGVKLRFRDNAIQLDDELVDAEWKQYGKR